MNSLHFIHAAWRAFFFTPESPAPVALFRIVFGTLLVVNALMLWPERLHWFGPDGYFAFSIYRKRGAQGRFSLFRILPAKELSVDLILGCHMLAAVLLTIGFATQESATVAFITLISLLERNPSISYGGDVVSCLMLFLLIFSPAGAMFSVDAYLFSGHGELIASSSPHCLRLMQIQVSILYLRSVIWKLRGETWRDGTALHYVFRGRSYRRFPPPKILLSPTLIRCMTYSVLLIESALGSLIWLDRFRYLALVVGVLLHLAIEYTLNIHLFSWIMIACLLLFIRPADLAHLLHVGR